MLPRAVASSCRGCGVTGRRGRGDGARGEEYEVDQTALVRELTRTAEGAGARLVVNSHPHVVGGITTTGRALIAESTGNLLFDQTVWPTFLSYLLRTDIRDGAPVLATVDPLLLDDYQPRPTVGWLADAAARRAAGYLPGPLRLQSPGAVYAPQSPDSGRRTRREVPAGSVLRLAPGWWVPQPGGQAVLGEDLLWTGSFEDMDLDPGTQGAHGWTLGGDVEHTPRASCASESGVELRRAPLSPQNVVLAPAHRQLLPRGESLRVTLFADVRRATAGGSLELALFQDTRGGSFTSHRVPVPVGEHDVDACQRVRLDVAVPPGVVAMQPFVRLSPHPDNVRSSHLGVDNVRLVAWAAPGAGGRRYDTLAAESATTVELVSDGPDAGTDPVALR